MRVWYVEHEGLYLGGYSSVVAKTERGARRMVRNHLAKLGFRKSRGFELHEIDTSTKGCTLIWDGDY